MYTHGLYIQLVDRQTGERVEFPGGSNAEADLVATIRDEVVKLGVGLFKSTDHVAKDIEQGTWNAFKKFKSRTVTG